ncbi:Allyl alcohol dehydrogenase-like protein [Quillaja saponaria]|uniref:Allyl alcohol dehydrogenase-like protein n=1 Tax=Quillaja saponaria TaxID=32244 RepID=A0AAD7L6S7_QUISA|nr:Allyl alcohol dehydrogenase-like protein [Quillaja saponaria]KAJ7952639.1 Allyl alcohol dehydrogenase-like protein [Quillaja saponaria]KAJ7952640.1 Allyl alcohol dehydrogenase-like protein [Quillaja saponaria]
MGLLSWWKGKPPQPEGKSTPSPNVQPKPAEVPGMNGAVEVPRPASITVFEFGSVAASADKVTLAGFCPVSEELEPCRWEILPASGSDAPQFRVVF